MHFMRNEAYCVTFHQYVRQLVRLQDSRFNFLFHPGDDYTPDLAGKTKKDLDELICSWIGHDKPITVLDVSGLPSETLSTIVGTLIRIVYDMLLEQCNTVEDITHNIDGCVDNCIMFDQLELVENAKQIIVGVFLKVLQKEF